MNYFDILLAKKLEDDRDPKVEGLSVTENGRYHEDGVVYDPVIVNVPETPLSKLTVTQNGTYTAPSGTAYSEVDVDVPLPSNAYLLKEIEDVEIASFNDGSDLSMPKLEVGIEPVQEGSGDPSPTNIRPISGWDEVNVGVSGGEDILDLTQASNTSKNEYGVTITFNSDNSVTINGTTTGQSQIVWTFAYSIALNFKGKFLAGINDCTLLIEQASSPYSKWAIVEDGDVGKVISENINNAANLIIRIPSGKTFNNRVIKPIIYDVQTITLDLDGTRYGGKVDLVSGVMTVDRVGVNMGSLTWTYDQSLSRFYSTQISDKRDGLLNDDEIMCSCFRPNGAPVSDARIDGTIAIWDRCYVKWFEITDATVFKERVTGQTFTYPLATPITIQLSPTVVKSLRGMNNVFADSGNILDLSYLAKEE
jgi:hypothetical protein